MLGLLGLSFALLPFVEERFERRLSRSLPPLSDFVLIYRHSPAVDSLTSELEDNGVPAVIVEADEELGRRLRDRGRRVVLGQLEEEDLDLEQLKSARAVVANGADHENAVMILSARQQGYKGPIYAFVEKPSHRHPMVLAGATAAYTPRHVLAAALAAKASERIAPRISGLRHLGAHLEIRELRIQPDSELAGKSLAEARLRARTGSTVIAQWSKAGFDPKLTPDRILHAGSIVLALGSSESIERLSALATPLVREGAFIVAGHGEVGSKLSQLLQDVGETVRTIDRIEKKGVDVVGDALDPTSCCGLGSKKRRRSSSPSTAAAQPFSRQP